MRLLHIDSSIQDANSASRTLSALIVERLTAAAPDLQVTYRDLAASPLPHLTLPGSDAQVDTTVLEEFLAANIVVIGAPMYNFGLPSQLKAWIDQIVIAGKTFQYGADGVVLGMASDKCVVIAHSRGGLYGAETPSAGNEHAESHLRAVFNFLGVADIEFIVAEGLAYGPEPREAAMAKAREQIENIVSTRKVAA